MTFSARSVPAGVELTAEGSSALPRLRQGKHPLSPTGFRHGLRGRSLDRLGRDAAMDNRLVGLHAPVPDAGAGDRPAVARSGRLPPAGRGSRLGDTAIVLNATNTACRPSPSP